MESRPLLVRVLASAGYASSKASGR